MLAGPVRLRWDTLGNALTFMQCICYTYRTPGDARGSVFPDIYTMYILCLQDQSGYGGTPLAMLAAQCSRISNKSPPPLADAAIGKGFHPWKKQGAALSPPSAQQVNSQRVASGGQAALTTTSTAIVTSSATGGYPSDLLSTTNTSPIGQTSPGQSMDNMSKLQSEPSSLSTISNMYSRVPGVTAHPYDSAAWAYNMSPSTAAVQQAAAIKTSEINSSMHPSAGSWWDIQSSALASSAWLSDIPSATTNSLQHPLAAQSSYPAGMDYTYSFAAASSPTSSFLAASTAAGGHALQESYKSMFPTTQTELGSTMSSAFLSRPTSLTSVTG